REQGQKPFAVRRELRVFGGDWVFRSIGNLTALRHEFGSDHLPDVAIVDLKLEDDEGHCLAWGGLSAVRLLRDRGFDGPIVAYVSGFASLLSGESGSEIRVFSKLVHTPRQVMDSVRDLVDQDSTSITDNSRGS
ncbi:MAG: hypothetical protein ACE5FA_08915, partial [Dehalococcoidia bacterium]